MGALSVSAEPAPPCPTPCHAGIWSRRYLGVMVCGQGCHILYRRLIHRQSLCPVDG